VKILHRRQGPRALVVLLVAAAVALCLCNRVRAQDAASPTKSAVVSFSFERPGLEVPRFTLRVAEDGRGSYQGEESAPASPYPGKSTTPDPIDRSFTLSAASTRKIFGFAHELHFFNTRCDSKAKNVADTGKKTLSYKGPDGEGSCMYNYSENKSVTQLTEMLQNIAATMDAGRNLDHLHRYDRLGLDAAIAFLAQQVAEGRALELGTIQATLRSIANDADVLQRVRTRATALLAMVPEDLREP
jgi:hypothetical protein